MLRFLLRRLAVAVPTLFLVVTLTFFMMRAAPGGPFDGERKLPAEIEQSVRARYGLDQPLVVQYANYLSGVVRGDFGPSLRYRDRTVLSILADNYQPSLIIGGCSLIIAALVGISLGIVAALRHNRPPDYAVMAVAILGVCIPTFVTGPLLVLVFASNLGWFPTAGWQETTLAVPILGNLPRPANIILPVIVLALPQIAIISRLTRAGMIEVLSSNYVRTARSRGLSERRVVVGHALRSALTPLVSYLGPAFAGILTGSLIVEQVFNLPGLGKFFVQSALQRDYTVVMGMTILFASLILILNLAADLIYAALDPRLRLT